MYQTEALSSFWSPFITQTQTLHIFDDPYPPIYMYVGYGQFHTDILAHLRFKHIKKQHLASHVCRLKGYFRVSLHTAYQYNIPTCTQNFKSLIGLGDIPTAYFSILHLPYFLEILPPSKSRHMFQPTHPNKSRLEILVKGQQVYTYVQARCTCMCIQMAHY